MWKMRSLAAVVVIAVGIYIAFSLRRTTPVEATRNTHKPLLVTYVGNEPAELPKFEHWLGRAVDGHNVHTGAASWKDWESSIPWEIDLWKNTDRPIFWSVPLIVVGSTLADGAKGAYNEHYHKGARMLADASQKRDKIYVRTGWEFNGAWAPWTAIGKADDYAETYRQFVKSFRAESNKFVFEWTPNQGDQGMDPATAYPGDAYVDVIGMDFYWHLQWDPKDPVAAWKSKVGDPWGLQWLDGFAKKHKKPTSFPEWGIQSNDAGPYLRLAAQWFATHDVVYQSYWNSNADFTGKLSDEQYREAGRVYRTQFGPAPAKK
jgi:hypothetical protein